MFANATRCIFESDKRWVRASVLRRWARRRAKGDAVGISMHDKSPVGEQHSIRRWDPHPWNGPASPLHNPNLACLLLRLIPDLYSILILCDTKQTDTPTPNFMLPPRESHIPRYREAAAKIRAQDDDARNGSSRFEHRYLDSTQGQGLQRRGQ